jgi:hypothetical protein
LRRPGRPRRYNGNEIVELIDERRTAAQNQGRSLSRPEALAELLAEVLKKRNPAKFNKIEEYRKYYERQGRCPKRGLALAVEKAEGAHMRSLLRLVSYALKGRRSQK